MSTHKIKKARHSTGRNLSAPISFGVVLGIIAVLVSILFIVRTPTTSEPFILRADPDKTDFSDRISDPVIGYDFQNTSLTHYIGTINYTTEILYSVNGSDPYPINNVFDFTGAYSYMDANEIYWYIALDKPEGGTTGVELRYVLDSAYPTIYTIASMETSDFQSGFTDNSLFISFSIEIDILPTEI